MIAPRSASVSTEPAGGWAAEWTRFYQEVFGLTVDFASVEGRLNPGDRFYLYTDGLADGVNGGLATSPAFRAQLAETCTRNATAPSAMPRMRSLEIATRWV